MTRRVFIIHGWSGHPNEGWFPWLKKELEKKGFRVIVPAMPNPDKPEIKTWVSFLKKQVGTLDRETFLVGHSIGCQTILRYLESLPPSEKVGGVVLVAGWVNLTPAVTESEEEYPIVKPWLETPINWTTIRTHTNQFVYVFSYNDPYVPVTDSEIFKKQLGAHVYGENGKGHLGGEDKVSKLPRVLEELLKMAIFS